MRNKLPGKNHLQDIVSLPRKQNITSDGILVKAGIHAYKFCKSLLVTTGIDAKLYFVSECQTSRSKVK